jgi:hypothetical protein
MAKKPEIVPKSRRTPDDIAATVDVLNVTLFALLSDEFLRDSSVKGRMLMALSGIRNSGDMTEEFILAYDRAIDRVKSLGT